MSKKAQKNKKAQAASQFENFQTKKDIRESLDKLFEKADSLEKSKNDTSDQPTESNEMPALFKIFDITEDVQENTRKAINLFNQIKIVNEQ